jgi:hypothetical protein
MLAHVTTDGGNSGDRFVTLVAEIVSTSSWQHQDEGSAVDRARRVVSGGPLMIRLQIPGIHAKLELEYRPHTTVLCDVILSCSLDPHLPHSDSGFIGRVATAHNAIAQRYATPYLEPQTDPHVILLGTVPQSVGTLSIQTMAAGLSTAALETAWLHKQIQLPVEEFLTGTDDTTSV